MSEKTNQPASLYNYAKNVLIKYINTIEDVGDIPYSLLEPVLKKITSPHQLKKLEANSPQIAGEDQELWKKFIIRDFGVDAVEKWTPKNPTGWSKVYDKHQKEAFATQERAAQLLKAQFEGLNSSKESGRARLVEAKSLPPLRRPRTGGSGWGSSANSWNHAAGSKTKNIIQKARREAKEIGIYSGARSRLAADTSTLRRGGVSETLQRKIRTAEEVKKMADPSRNSGRASGAVASLKDLKRKAEMVGDEDEEDEEEKRLKMEEKWQKAQERRDPVVGGLRLKVLPERKAPEPFMKPKKANPLALPPPRRR